MKIVLNILFIFYFIPCTAQIPNGNSDKKLLAPVLASPTQQEIDQVLTGLRQLDLSPKNVVIHDTVILSNKNKLYVISSVIEGNKHYGAVIVPDTDAAKLPVILFATGGDGMHTRFDITEDFNHKAAQFPSFLGDSLDKRFIVVIPSFRGQKLVTGKKGFQSEGNVNDAFDGAATDALGLLNVVLQTFTTADQKRVAVFGGSRGGAVALLASSRDTRIKKAVVVAAPNDVNALYHLYPDQFKLLFFKELLAGTITESEARKKFIASSPIYFAKELPPVQLHHDANDPFVPITFAQKLTDSLTSLKKEVYFYTYKEGIHGFWQDELYWKRVQEFIGELAK